MKATRATTLLWWAIPTTILSYLAVAIVISRGLPAPVSPTNLSITLVSISVVLLLLAFPIWRYRNSLKNSKPNQRPKRVDPFYAVRVVLLAKATSLAGTLFASWHLGVLIYQLSAAVIVPVAIARNAFGLLASLFMIAAGLVVEYLCKLPDDPDASDPSEPAAT